MEVCQDAHAKQNLYAFGPNPVMPNQTKLGRMSPRKPRSPWKCLRDSRNTNGVNSNFKRFERWTPAEPATGGAKLRKGNQNGPVASGKDAPSVPQTPCLLSNLSRISGISTALRGGTPLLSVKPRRINSSTHSGSWIEWVSAINCIVTTMAHQCRSRNAGLVLKRWGNFSS